jgi:hypothetical protein
MKEYFKSFEDYNQEDSTNEGIMDFLKAASGAVKNFVNGISAPFKNFKADFQKGLDAAQAKTQMIKKLDDSLAQAIKNINSVKEQSEIGTLVDSFQKVIDNMILDFDKSIATVKESNQINEGKIQDTLIGGRIFLGLVKDEITKFSEEFKKKFAAAKNLADAKNLGIESLKKMVTEAKKKISDQNIVDQAVAKYKEEKKIETKPAEDTSGVVLNWGDVEVTVKPSKEKPGFYQVVATNSKILNFKEGDILLGKLPPVVNVGKKVLITELERNGTPEQNGKYQSGVIQKIVDNGKDVTKFTTGVKEEDPTKKAQEELGKIKTDDAKMSKVVKFTKFIQDDKNKDKIDEIEKIIGAEIVSDSYFHKGFQPFLRG